MGIIIVVLLLFNQSINQSIRVALTEAA